MAVYQRFAGLFLGLLLLMGGSAAIARPHPPETFSADSPNGLVIIFTRVAPGPRLPEPKLSFQPVNLQTGRIGDHDDVSGDDFEIGRGAGFFSNADRQEWEGWAVEAEPGTYVLLSARNPNSGGSRTIYRRPIAFEVRPGEISYLGDFSFFWGGYEPPNAGEIARDWLTAFFTLGLVLPGGQDYSALITWDEDRARSFLEEVTQTELPMVRAAFDCPHAIAEDNGCLIGPAGEDQAPTADAN